MRIPVVFFTLFALGMVNGCVSQTTYDAVVQEGLRPGLNLIGFKRSTKPSSVKQTILNG